MTIYNRKPKKNLNNQKLVREDLIDTLYMDLLGPSDENEKLRENPIRNYEIGKIYPIERSNSKNIDDEVIIEEDEDVLDPNISEEFFSKNPENVVEVSVKRKMVSIGISCKPSKLDKQKVKIIFTGAIYKIINPDTDEVTTNFNYYNATWKRFPFVFKTELSLLENKKYDILGPTIHGIENDIIAELHLTIRGEIITISIINKNELFLNNENMRGKLLQEAYLTIFQPKIKLEFSHPLLSISKTKSSDLIDEIDEIAFLYRKRKAFAIGHNCSAEWELKDNPCNVMTSIIPKFRLPPLIPRQINENSDSYEKMIHDPSYLMNCDKDELHKALLKIKELYSKWIDSQINKSKSLSSDDLIIANKNIDKCNIALNRISDGIELIYNNKDVRYAFLLMNKSIDYQYSIKNKLSDNPFKFYWRHFQIGFILQSLHSTLINNHVDRDIVDLLWFPTGGGKTECYNGLSLTYLFYLRITDEKAIGVSIITRYTLRLLTLQQFNRSAEVICAAEVIRKQELPHSHPFSVGIWVGGDLTPNNRKEAKKQINGKDPLDIIFLINECPFCKSKIVPEDYVYDPNRIYIKCPDTNEKVNCQFSKALPIYFIDEDIYDYRPSLLIGTVDKFAQIPLNEKINSIFGIKPKITSPGLVIQDEMHLISGPLGSIVGIYEMLIDGLISIWSGVRPKIITSTATVRDADRQIQLLYNRETNIFPPNGLEISDNYFSYEANSDANDRLYLGLPEGTRASLFLIIRGVSALAQRCLSLLNDHKVSRKYLDAYWSNVIYFNSLKELGMVISASEEDIPNRLRFINYKIRKELSDEEREKRVFKYNVRSLELNSRIKTSEVKSIISKMNLSLLKTDNPVDLLLSSNMLSVGIDIGRLGLMFVVGQPMNNSEYIQATSRVGRSGNGLIFVIYRMAYPRDRSYYETFWQFHNAMYSYVDPSSLTPFSYPVRLRAFHAVVIGLIRHLHQDTRLHDQAGNIKRSLQFIDKIKEFIELKIKGSPQLFEDEKSAVIRQLEDLMEKIYVSTAQKREYRNDLLIPSTEFEINFNDEIHQFATLNSMRDVDGELYLIRKEE